MGPSELVSGIRRGKLGNPLSPSRGKKGMTVFQSSSSDDFPTSPGTTEMSYQWDKSGDFNKLVVNERDMRNHDCATSPGLASENQTEQETI